MYNYFLKYATIKRRGMQQPNRTPPPQPRSRILNFILNYASKVSISVSLVVEHHFINLDNPIEQTLGTLALQLSNLRRRGGVSKHCINKGGG